MSLVNIVLALVFFIAVVLSVVIFVGSKKSKGTVYMGWASLWASLWVLSMLLFRVANTVYFLNFPSRALYVSGILISLSFLMFSFVFLDHSPNPIARHRTRILLYLLTLLLVGATIFTTTIISDVTVTGGNTVLFGELYPLYGAVLISHFFWAYINFFKRYRKVNDKGERVQLRYIIVGTLVSVVAGLYFDILAPYLLRDFRHYWVGPALIVLFVGITTFAISKYRLFSIRVIAGQLFIFALWIFVLVRTILSDTANERIINGGLFISTVIIGVLLIRSIFQEVQTRERMEGLANELAGANERLTQLDQQKSEFLSIASHQLRSPLTAIKGYSSMILEGSFGPVTGDKLREAVDRIFLSAERLVIIVEDFLNVSRIEQGRMQYDFSTVNLEELVDGVVKELEQNSKKAGLTVTFEKGANGPFFIHADFGKVRQMVTNLLDNAIKYTKQGSIALSINKDSATRKILVKIKDTGIGIAPEVITLLFQKFSRDKNAGKVNIMGTGLGLYVVKELMKAHKGSVWVDSPGEGKGSTFYLEFMAE